MKKGFTLIELLVVIAIIGLLSSIILASLSVARAKALLAAGEQFASSMDNVEGDQAVGTWNFSECSGSIAGDTSSDGNTGTLFNSPTWITTTPNGSGCALTFNGTNQYISVPDSSTLHFTGDVTYSAWVKVTSYSGSYVDIIDKTCFGYSLWINPANKIAFAVQCSAPVATGPALSLGVWHFVAGVYTASTGVMNLYVDGTLAATASGAASITSVAALTIGKGQDGYFPGSIDSVHLFTKTLTAADIHDLYLAEAPAFKVAMK